MSCVCQSCGIQYRIDIMVEDWVWEEIKPKWKPQGSGLLCGSCIMKRLEQLMIDIDGYSYYHLTQ